MAALSGTAQTQSAMRLFYNQKAQYFEESLPIGNGKLGALVYGGADTCFIHLNDITFWTGKPVSHQEGAGASQWIPEIRTTLRCGQGNLLTTTRGRVLPSGFQRSVRRYLQRTMPVPTPYNCT